MSSIDISGQLSFCASLMKYQSFCSLTGVANSYKRYAINSNILKFPLKIIYVLPLSPLTKETESFSFPSSFYGRTFHEQKKAQILLTPIQ